MSWTSFVIAATALAISCAGCTEGTCGEGTVRYGDTWGLYDPFDKTPPVIAVDPPLYTREVKTVRLTSDKPATIYYTLDGTPVTTDSPHGRDQVVIPDVPDNTQLRYFGIDVVGNQSAEQVRIWIIDRDGPAAPVDFALALNGSERTVSWTMPPDPRPGGVLVARIDGRLGAPPVSGTTYAVGDTLSPGVTVAAVDATNVTSFVETLPVKPGLVRYVAWAFDDLHNYGPAAGDYTNIPLPTQTTALTVTASTGAVAVTTPPANLTMSGTATLVGGTLTVKLAVRNDAARVLFAPKVVLVTALPAGVTWTNSDGTLAAHPYRVYGGAIVPNTTAVETWVFTGATSATVLDLGLEIDNGYVMTATVRNSTSAGTLVDQATGSRIFDLGAPPTGQGGGATTRRGGITPDGRILFGSRTTGSVASFDLVNGHRTTVTTLRAPKSNVPEVILDKSGSTAYVLIADGHPNAINNQSNGAGTVTQLARLDAATLTEFTPRIDLGMSRNRGIDLSPDGKTIIVATGITSEGVIVVDLPTLQIKTRIVTDFRPQVALFTPDGGSVVIVGEKVAVYSLDGKPGVTYATPGTNGKVNRAAFLTPTVLAIGRQRECVTVDLGSGVTQEFATIPAPLLEVFDGKIFAGSRSGGIKRVDATGVVEATVTGFTSNALEGHWIGRSPF